MIHIVWEFRARPEQQPAFEQYYAGDGQWAALFRHSPAYVATTCIQDLADPNHYLVTDVWKSLEAFQDFKQKCRDDYQQLDNVCEAFTLEEKQIGVFRLGK